jgi:hypothetical protein
VVNGVATFYGCSINLGSASYYTLSATSSPTWTPATSSAFYIGAAEHLAFTTQPGGGAAGAIWNQQPVVAVENTSNQIVTTDNSTIVTLSIATNPAGGTLSCTSGTSRTVVNGVATFYGCSINLGSASYYTLSATSSPTWTPATSSAFYIGTGTNLTFVTQPGGGQPNVAWTQQPVVSVRDNYGNVVTTPTYVTLSMGTNPGGGTLYCSGGTSVYTTTGYAYFTGCYITAAGTGYTLVASASGLTSVTSAAFNIGSTLTPVTITDTIAAGVNRGTSGFGIASLVVPANSYVTVLAQTSPNLAGALVQIWVRTKTVGWHSLTLRQVAADGAVHYFARVNGWTAYWVKFAGNSTYAAAASHGRIATNPD